MMEQLLATNNVIVYQLASDDMMVATNDVMAYQLATNDTY
jgi:hypothetical protein